MMATTRALLTRQTVLFCLLTFHNVANRAGAAPKPVEMPAWRPEAGSSEIGQQQDQEGQSYVPGEGQQHEVGSMGQSRFKSTISSLLQPPLLHGYTAATAVSKQAHHQTGSNQHIKFLRSAAAQISSSKPHHHHHQLVLPLATNNEHQNPLDEYRCAKYCSCSVIQVMDKSNDKRANLTRAHCESSQFTDLLTIDRRTHIIHISLPDSEDETPAAAATDEDGITLTGSDGPPPPPEAGGGARLSAQQRNSSFRMPRLIQFNLLREIVIINLRFEVCDSEVFKRGQRMRRLQLNHNKLSRISKACLKHLDKLVELNLDYNRLEELESALFNSLLNLRMLSIAYNRLTELAAHQFANLTNLVSLNLVGNSFKSINLQLFEPMQQSLRLLLLAKNQIKSFIQAPTQQQTLINNNNNNSSSGKLSILSNHQTSSRGGGKNLPGNPTLSPLPSYLMIGVVFKNLIKLNVDENKFERIKLLQLHRFFNVKYLSIRKNNIATIRDKAFNGLKLIELNLAHNQLQTVSKCAFCNATIKRLVLSHNNISLPSQLAAAAAGNGDALASTLAASAGSIGGSSGAIVSRPLALNGTILLDDPSQSLATSALPLQAAANQLASSSQVVGIQAGSVAAAVSSSPNMLILSQSIFGPLFNQLEYLDLSSNQLLADQLELLLEPLLKLEYLNLASTGLDRYLPSPSLFKNLRQLKYLNLSHNQLDQVVAETVEPLVQLEVLDLSYNKFSELDESLLVTVDDIMTSLKVINFGSNPWFCSQCKVAPLYDWILRSPIYNLTCIAPQLEAAAAASTGSRDLLPTASLDDAGVGSQNADETSPSSISVGGEPELALRSPLSSSNGRLARWPQHYSLLVGNGDDTDVRKPLDMDMGLILESGGGDGSGNLLDEEMFAGHYNLLASDYLYNGGSSSKGAPISQSASYQALREGLASGEDDPSIGLTMLKVSQATSRKYAPEEYCLKCEFPGELRSFNIHELQSNDFKFCAGAAPRFAASEPKIGLTLAIVIIGALFCIIIIVIVMYRKKSNTYYTNEETDQLDGVAGGKKPVFSISSDAEHQYGDNTDYSSPPMSQSYDSYSQEDEEDDDGGGDGGLDEEDDEEGEFDEEEDDEDGDVLEEEDEIDDEEGVLDEDQHRHQHHHHHHHHHDVKQDERHNEKGKRQQGDSDNNNNNNHHHHVGYASDYSDKATVSDPQIQAAANAKRMAAAEQERLQQVAEYHHRNEKGPATASTTTTTTTTAAGGYGAPANQRTSGQGSSLSQADRSASGPVPSPHRHSGGSREPAKRQTSAHHQHHHQHQRHNSSSSTRSRPGTAAVAAVAMVAAASAVNSEKLGQPAVGHDIGSHSTTPSLVPSSLSGAGAAAAADDGDEDGGGPRNQPAGLGSTLSSGNSSTSAAGHHATARTPVSVGGRRQMAGASQHSKNGNSVDLGLKTPSGAKLAGGGRATLRGNESLVAGGGSGLQQHHHHLSREGSMETAATTAVGRQGSDWKDKVQLGGSSVEPPNMKIGQRDGVKKTMAMTSQTSDQTKAKFRPHSSGGGSGSHQHQHQRQPSIMGTGSRPTLVEREPSGEQQPPTTLPSKPSGSRPGIAPNRLVGRHRFAVSKEQKSQPAIEWAHLRQPVVEPPTEPHSLGPEQHPMVAGAPASHGINGLPPADDLDHGSAATLPEALPVNRVPPEATWVGPETRLGSVGNGPSQHHSHNNHHNPSHHHHHHRQQQQSSAAPEAAAAVAKATTERRHRSPSMASDDATTAESLALEALSYTASDLEGGPPDDDDDQEDEDVGGALEMDSSGSFGPDEFVNNTNNNDNIINESNSRQLLGRHHHHLHGLAGSGRLQAPGGGGYPQMRESHSSHSALTQTGPASRDEMM